MNKKKTNVTDHSMSAKRGTLWSNSYQFKKVTLGLSLVIYL